MIAPRVFSAGRQPPRAARHYTPTERKALVRTEFARLREGLAAGRITQAEHDLYLSRMYGGRSEEQVLASINAERRSLTPHILLLAVVLIGMLSVLLVTDGGITGYAVKESPMEGFPETYTRSANETLNITNTTTLRVTGSLRDGGARILLDTGRAMHLVFEEAHEQDPYSVSTPKKSYALDSSINASVEPDVPHTLWLTTPSGEKEAFTNGMNISLPGNYTLDALINDSGNVTKRSTAFTVRNDTNNSLDIARELPLDELRFTDACEETCLITATGNQPHRLLITLTGNATLTLANVTVTRHTSNQPPVQEATLPSLDLAVGESTLLDLDAYFSDPDGDTITYDYMNAPGITFTIEGSELSVTADEPGSHQSAIYASDLNELITSNTYTITVREASRPATDPTTNKTEPEVPRTNPANGTAVIDTEITQNETESNTPAVDPCAHPDPNKRPLSCLQNESAHYFQEQTIYITDTNRAPVARVTPIGNLLIGGDYFERATIDAPNSDYTVGYEDASGGYVPTVWFESATGDLHLAGALHEEQTTLEPSPGSYLIKNRKGIILAWADPVSGDLYVRGNLIPYRRLGE